MKLSAAEVGAALGTPVLGVDTVETFAASAADVARLRLRTADRPRFTVIAKLASGAGVAAARREVEFFERLAPLWDHPAPQLLGTSEVGDGLLLLTEDLAAAGYRIVGDAITDEQLRGAIDVLAGLHSRFWNEPGSAPALEPSVTSSAQAWPPEVISRHAAAVRTEADRFFAGTAELGPADHAVLSEVITDWEQRFLARVAGGALTLIHGDFHFLGNVFFAGSDPRPKVIDWSELKPGLGPHDLAYSLSGIPARQAGGPELLRYYWEALDVPDYSWELCDWDFRFSVISNLFQSVFQHSVRWYRASLAAIDAFDSRTALAEPPPVTAAGPGRAGFAR